MKATSYFNKQLDRIHIWVWKKWLTDVDFNKNTDTVNTSRRQKQSDTDPQEIWRFQCEWFSLRVSRFNSDQRCRNHHEWWDTYHVTYTHIHNMYMHTYISDTYHIYTHNIDMLLYTRGDATRFWTPSNQQVLASRWYVGVS